ncbi:MAG: hypothetical protein R3325_10605 [Thermoanaerobaculia bacterium]|nr:hypothetical protein [Thermoanaerobaculia bacterium]
MATRGRSAGGRLCRAAVTLAFAVGCVPAAGPELPEGTAAVGAAREVRPLLEALATLPESPLARWAGAALGALDGCEELELLCPPGGGCDPRERVVCGSGDARLEELVRRRGAAGWAVSHRGSGSRWLALGAPSGRGGGSRVELELEVAEELVAGTASLLLPAAGPPGAWLLDGDDAFLRLRLRPDGGLGLADLLPDEGWGARLFRLQGRLLEATTLEGTWELAVYLPEEGMRIPPMAMALDVGDRDRAEAAMSAFLTELESSWTLRRRAFSLAGGRGACLADLNVLPELEPCYLVTAGAVVLGWNASSLERAVAAPGDEPPPATSEARIDLDLLAVADRRLAGSSGGVRPPGSYPWRHLHLSGRREGGLYRFTLELSP